MDWKAIKDIHFACEEIRMAWAERNIPTVEGKMFFAQGYIEGFIERSTTISNLSYKTVMQLFELGLNMSLKP
jgi:hypothetical protein